MIFVPENIHTPTEGNGNTREGGGSKRRQIIPTGGGCLKRFFPGDLSKIGELLIDNSFITTFRTARKARMKTQRHIWSVILAGCLMNTMDQSVLY